MGGQTALNTAMALHRDGRLEKLGVELIGANAEAIDKAEDRLLFREAMTKIGLECPKSEVVHNREEAAQRARACRPAGDHPPVLHPGRHRRRHRLQPRRVSSTSCRAASTPRRSARCWSRNRCSAGKSTRWRSCATATTTASSSARSRTSIRWASTPAIRVTVAPALTLTDKEYQIMRNASIACLREIGVDTGGSNVQFAVDPGDRPHGRDRDEPARLALLGAGLEGDRLPDRQGRGAAGGRLHARRAAERHHRRRRRPRSSRRSTTSSPRCRASPSRSSPAPRRCSPPR